MFRFTIRELFLMTVIMALAIGWFIAVIPQESAQRISSSAIPPPLRVLRGSA